MTEAGSLFCEDAVTKESQQIHNIDTFVSKMANELMEEQKQSVVPSLMFLIEKEISQSKQGNVQMEDNKGNTYQKKKLHHPPLYLKVYSSLLLWMQWQSLTNQGHLYMQKMKEKSL